VTWVLRLVLTLLGYLNPLNVSSGPGVGPRTYYQAEWRARSTSWGARSPGSPSAAQTADIRPVDATSRRAMDVYVHLALHRMRTPWRRTEWKHQDHEEGVEGDERLDYHSASLLPSSPDLGHGRHRRVCVSLRAADRT